jgi:glucokinase
MNNFIFAGVDIGGTYIKTGFFNAVGECLAFEKTCLDPGKEPAGELQKIFELIKNYQSANMGLELKSIGIGMPGIIDHQKGSVSESGNMNNWIDFPVKKSFEDAFGVQVVFDNDANMAAFGEFTAGSGQGGHAMVLLTLGTGVGSAFIMEGEIFELNGFSPELGHMIIDYNGANCDCGRRGCLETFIGVNGLKKTLKTILKEGAVNDAIASRYKSFTPAQLSELAAQGDAIAIKTYKLAGHALGIAIANLLNLMRFDRVVVAGGISNAWEGFYIAIADTVKHTSFSFDAEKIQILKASLGDKAGVMGAGLKAKAEYLYNISLNKA